METTDRIVTVRGEEELLARAGHLFTSVREDFLCAARDPDTWSQPAARHAVRDRMRTSGTGAFTVRKLFSPTALADEPTRAHLHRVSAAGALVRISAAPLPHETIIIDRRLMVLAGPATPAGREYTITASPVLLGSVLSLFEAAWETSPPFTSWLTAEAPHLDPGSRAVLQALGSGLTDETAARRLGLSLRTYRRRVAALMTALQADSRFQAGLHAAAFGLAEHR
ncbi:helix-turn-helix domain-containing protein [Actinocorallia populi]|uniref:LuxR family transcriptional regulator n=1 Tax=Actinocorallia populi TaxID=2079200 RepID=UPI000D08F7F9|nr:LuxR family transcriptional regulator [Actinocorallia populi]